MSSDATGREAAGPVDTGERIAALDSVRGFALLGILLVNIHLFGGPFGEFILPAPPEGSSAADVAAFYFTKVFCESRFYPLFSLLFGMGLVLQMRSVERKGERFAALYARRLAVLMLLGAVHIVGLWYGDILLIYGTVGWALLLVRRWSARSLLITAGVILAAATVMTVGLSTLMVLAEASKERKGESAGQAAVAPAEGPAAVGAPVEGTAALAGGGREGPAAEVGGAVPATPSAPVSGDAADASSPAPETRPEPTTPIGRLFRDFETGEASDPSSAGWVRAETEAFRDGGFLNAVAMRLFLYAVMIVFSIFGFGWHVLVMFLIGAALVKLDVLAPENRPMRRRLMLVGLGVGMPLSVLMALVPAVLDKTAAAPILGLLAMGTATLTALGYFGGIFLLAESGRAAWLTRALGAAGRMALTVYLCETVIATFIMYHWGLAMFGEFSRAERTLLAFAIYVPLVALSVLWMRRFRIGPVEWVWRTATYLRAPALLRDPGASPGASSDNQTDRGAA